MSVYACFFFFSFCLILSLHTFLRFAYNVPHANESNPIVLELCRRNVNNTIESEIEKEVTRIACEKNVYDWLQLGNLISLLLFFSSFRWPPNDV